MRRFLFSPVCLVGDPLALRHVDGVGDGKADVAEVDRGLDGGLALGPQGHATVVAAAPEAEEGAGRGGA